MTISPHARIDEAGSGFMQFELHTSAYPEYIGMVIWVTQQPRSQMDRQCSCPAAFMAEIETLPPVLRAYAEAKKQLSGKGQAVCFCHGRIIE